MAHDTRYERAAEFVETVEALWDSFEDDAFIRDKASGVYYDVDKLHVVTKHGRYISAAGPLNCARPIQGYPVIAQAGSSQTGREFAARYGEVIFTLQAHLDSAKAFYDETKGIAVDFGRSAEAIKILPALTMVVARTDEEAKEKFELLDSLVDPAVGLELLSAMIDMDLSDFPIDGPLPDVAETELGTKTVQKFFVDKARREQLTIRQLISFMLRWGAIGGSPQTIADYIQEWIEAGAADGFNVTFADLPSSFDGFVDGVVPELQRRGIFQTEYRGATLRENLGLERPVNQFSGAAVVAR
jgi:N-acetyl-S-(2-succino)cysteine monooxygenase